MIQMFNCRACSIMNDIIKTFYKFIFLRCQLVSGSAFGGAPVNQHIVVRVSEALVSISPISIRIASHLCPLCSTVKQSQSAVPKWCSGLARRPCKAKTPVRVRAVEHFFIRNYNCSMTIKCVKVHDLPSILVSGSQKQCQKLYLKTLKYNLGS